MSGFDHIHKNFQHVLLLSDKERMEFMDQPRWIPYTIAVRILDELQALMNKPKKPRMPNLLLVGDPNNGKTTILEHFKEVSGKAYSNAEDETVIPLIIAEAPPKASEKDLYLSILSRFLTPHRPTDTASKLRFQVVNLFRRFQVRMLIIDELHSLLTGPALKQREVMNAIKYLCNELRIPIVGAGTKDAVRVLHTDPQHASRFEVITLPTWGADRDFQRLLAAFENVLPLKKPSRIHEPQIASALHAISGGNLGDLHKLLIGCAKDAIRGGQECIDHSIVMKHKWIQPTRGIRNLVL